MKAAPKAQKTGVSDISQICACFGLKRDAWYKYQKRFQKRETVHSTVVEMVKQERKYQPRVGTRKLLKALHHSFEAAHIKVGRDSLFNILREKNMLVRRKRASCKTTNSYHHFHKYGNLVKDMEITAPNQVWVADITYLRTVKGFCYLALLTDLFSRKIVGYDISDSLELTGCLGAFKRAQKAARPAAGLVHHSDRGFQYCSNQYVNELKKHKVRISMTEENPAMKMLLQKRLTVY
jgi:putative transposase